MENYLRTELPGRWLARVAAVLTTALPQGGGAARVGRGREGGVSDAHPTTMQTIKRVSASHQEKLGLNVLCCAGESRKVW